MTISTGVGSRLGAGSGTGVGDFTTFTGAGAGVGVGTGIGFELIGAGGLISGAGVFGTDGVNSGVIKSGTAGVAAAGVAGFGAATGAGVGFGGAGAATGAAGFGVVLRPHSGSGTVGSTTAGFSRFGGTATGGSSSGSGRVFLTGGGDEGGPLGVQFVFAGPAGVTVPLAPTGTVALTGTIGPGAAAAVRMNGGSVVVGAWKAVGERVQPVSGLLRAG